MGKNRQLKTTVIIWLSKTVSLYQWGYAGGTRMVAGSQGSPAVVGEVLQEWELMNEVTAAFLLASGGTNTAGKYCLVDRRGGI